MFGYEFINLTPEQVEIRRKLLDQAGFQAYLLPILLLLTVYLIRNLSRTTSGDQSKVSSKNPTNIQLCYRRLKWLLEDTYISEYGPLHVQLLGLLYISALLYIITKDTGKDYMHVTKAFGHVAVSQLPVQYLLSFKHHQSPIALATGLTHERLNAYHRLFGRMVHGLLAIHAILYLRFFVAINVLSKRVKDWDARYGLIAFWTVNFLGLLSLAPVRRRAYHTIFHRSHGLLSLVLVIVVWLHVPYTRNYIGQAAFFWVTTGILRKVKMSENATVRGKKLSSDLIAITATMKEAVAWETWVPGMHGYISPGGSGPRTPFTVLDVYEKGGQAQIDSVVKNTNGPMTARLNEAATHDKALSFEVEGPYGEAKEYMPDVLKRIDEPTLIVAGGVGATYALPIYLALTEKRKSTSNVQLIWIVRNLEDARWGIDMLRGKAHRNVHIFITQGKNDSRVAPALELPGIKIFTSRKRPDFSTVVANFLYPVSTGYRPMSIMVCGPGSLSKDLRKAVAQYAWSGRKVRWFEEQFAFGGS